MKKQEVLTLLERFPDLVDSDELLDDLLADDGDRAEVRRDEPVKRGEVEPPDVSLMRPR